MTRSLQRDRNRAFAWTASIPLFLGAITFWAAGQFRHSIDSVSHSDEVIVAIQDILLTVTYAESSQRGLLLTGDELFRSKYTQARDQMRGKIGNLRRLTKDNRTQELRVDKLSALVQSRFAGMEGVLAVRLKGRLPNSYAVDLMRGGGVIMTNIRHVCEDLEQEERRLLGIRIRKERGTEIDVVISLVVGTLISVALLYWAHHLSEQYSLARDRAEAELRSLNTDLETRVVERTAELILANERLSRSNRDLVDFASVASHDLQEPLRTIGSYAGLLARRYEGKLDEKAERYIRHLVDGAKRMQTLVQDLLSYSRAGTQQLQLETVNMESVLGEVVESMHVSLIERCARITHDPLPVLRADPGRLGQVLQNLIGNAAKFAKPGEVPLIHVGVRLVGRDWVFSVQDNGIGFDPQYAERIFMATAR
jgi:signal transduction histidine kinase